MEDHLPIRGWLAVPMAGHGGKNLGLGQFTDPVKGEFTEEDEAILVQLAEIAIAGIESIRLYKQVREQDQRKEEFSRHWLMKREILLPLFVPDLLCSSWHLQSVPQ